MTSVRFLEVSFDDNGKVPEILSLQNNAPMPFATTQVFWVPIVAARLLTTGEDVKTIIDLSLDISGAHIKVDPGDTIGILPRNPSAKVQQVFERLGIQKDADRVCHITILKNTTKKNPSVPTFIPTHSTLRYIFERCLDLQSIPKKLFLKSLLEYTCDPSDKSYLQDLSCRDSEIYTSWTTSSKASIIGILEQCPSCNPPVGLLLEQLPRLLPRPYSVSYFSGKEKHMHILFSVLKPDGMRSKGLCTGWLEELSNPLYTKPEDKLLEEMRSLTVNEKSASEIQVPIFFRKSTGFIHPEDPLRPLVMVGPGTGVAPFLGFLQQRQKLVNKIGKDGVGECWLFFGCRYAGRDNIFQEEILEYQKQGILSNFVVSYSREGGEVKYVQDNLKKFGAEISEILLEKNGVIYVCGDSANMGKDVKECIRDEIAKKEGLSKEEGNEIMKNLIAAKQYIEDLWS